jgi:hypothetical protein
MPNYELTVELNPRGKKHRAIINALTARLKRSYDDMSRQYTRWAEQEEQYQAYVPAETVDKPKRALDPEQTNYSEIYVPYSYAMGMTAHTYLTSVFLGRSPVYQVAGRHGEGENKTLAMEALMDYQLMVGEHLVPHYIWQLDPIKYGVGFLGHYWVDESITTTVSRTAPKTFLGLPIPGTEQTIIEPKTMPGYSGIKLFNIRPQDAFPDTRVPVWRFQQGEFFARYVEIPWHEVKQGESAGEYFNLQFVSTGSRMSRSGYESSLRDRGGAVSDLPNDVENLYTEWEAKMSQVSGVLKGYEFTWRIVPNQWGLGQSNQYEMWVFTMTLGDVIVRARPLGLYHGRFPVDVLEWEPDGYNILPRSALQITSALEDLMNWLVNSHMYNVRSTLYNQFLYDPSMVVGRDIERPGPGRAIRIKPAAYGRDIRTFFQQLPIQDVTQQNLQNAQYVAEIMQRVLGVTENVMGQVNTSGRKTATEIRASTSFAVNRLKTIAEYYSAMGYAPFVQKMVQTSQQYFDQTRQFKVVGDLATFSPQFMAVTPEDIAGFYDYVPVDGTFPVDRFAQANLWQMILGQMTKMPQVLMQYDVGKIFAWVATLAGIKNIQQFRVQIMDPAKMQQMAQAGNVVPISAAQGGQPPDLNRGSMAAQVGQVGSAG